MKYLIFFISCIVSMQCYSQASFEGTVKWVVTINNSDNKKAAAYQTGIAEEDLSEQNEAIAELEQQLNDPEIQKILLAHPPIKGNMEKRLAELKAAQGNSDYEGTNSEQATIFPSAIYVALKNGNSLTEMEGGTMSAMIGNILYVKNQDAIYYIKDATETYTVKPNTSYDSIHIGIAKTKDTAMIANYPCTKFIITCTDNDETTISYVWITQNIRNMNPYAFQSLGSSAGSLHNDAFEHLPGVPLRIESNEKGFKMTMEVTEIVKQMLPDSDFVIPLNYKEATFGY